MKVVTAEEMRDIERQTMSRGVTLDHLMDRAAQELADSITSVAGEGGILLLAGPGNNGGDGVLAAAKLMGSGYDVAVYTFKRPSSAPFDGPTVRAEDDPNFGSLKELVKRASVIVDCLLGIGQNRAPDDTLAGILEASGEARRQDSVSIACDIPTGVNADTGAVPGAAFNADLTVAMGFPKRGNVLYPGAQCNGELRIADVGLARDAADSVLVTLPSDKDIAALLPRRAPDSNKGTYGSVLFVGGSQDFCGAPALSSLAAYRAGAGLVDVAVPASIQPIVAAHGLEPIYTRLPEEDGKIAPSAIHTLEHPLEKVDVVVFGPGMGRSDRTVEFARGFVPTVASSDVRGMVVDADALNCLSEIDGWWESAARLILTPHPGEMSRLTGMSIADIQSDRIAVAQQCAALWQQTVVLKGARTIVAAPDERVSINSTGGPNLATGGTGDVLSGTIAGLLAQGMDAFDAAVAGVYVHGRAGDLLAEQNGNAGTLAGDLLPEIPRAIRDIQQEGT